MTVIASLVHKGHIYMGGDSAGVAGTDMHVRSDPKVFFNGEYLIGFTTSFRMGQLLRYAAKLPVPPENDLHGFMVTTFVDAIRETFKDSGWGKKTSEREEGGCFLVGVRGKLFDIGGDYGVGMNVLGYDAVGCGGIIAQGALHATKGMPPRQRITRALSAAVQHSSGVRGPFHILTTKEQ